MSKSTIDRTTVDMSADMATINATTPDKTTVNDATAAPEEGPAPGEGERAVRKARSRPIPCVKNVRRSLGLTQQAFAARYGIPLGTLRDWEQGRTEPDQPARAYIRVIASNPEWVSRALAAEQR